MPDDRDIFTILVMDGCMAGRISFRSEVGSGSRSEDLDGEAVIVAATSAPVTG